MNHSYTFDLTSGELSAFKAILERADMDPDIEQFPVLTDFIKAMLPALRTYT
jgi:hypothetical protein